MGLDLKIVKDTGPGRRALPLAVDVVREIDDADLEAIATRDLGSTSPQVQRITDRHHMLARLLASGMKDGDAAIVTGYDVSRISILKQSKAFQELLELYRQQVQKEFASVLDHMAGLSRDALMELRARIEDAPQKFSNREVMDLVTNFADRTVGVEQDARLPTRIELVAPGTEAPLDDGKD